MWQYSALYHCQCNLQVNEVGRASTLRHTRWDVLTWDMLHLHPDMLLMTRPIHDTWRHDTKSTQCMPANNEQSFFHTVTQSSCILTYTSTDRVVKFLSLIKMDIDKQELHGSFRSIKYHKTTNNNVLFFLRGLPFNILVGGVWCFGKNNLNQKIIKFSLRLYKKLFTRHVWDTEKKCKTNKKCILFVKLSCPAVRETTECSEAVIKNILSSTKNHSFLIISI